LEAGLFELEEARFVTLSVLALEEVCFSAPTPSPVCADSVHLLFPFSLLPLCVSHANFPFFFEPVLTLTDECTFSFFTYFHQQPPDSSPSAFDWYSEKSAPHDIAWFLFFSIAGFPDFFLTVFLNPR